MSVCLFACMHVCILGLAQALTSFCRTTQLGLTSCSSNMLCFAHGPPLLVFTCCLLFMFISFSPSPSLGHLQYPCTCIGFISSCMRFWNFNLYSHLVYFYMCILLYLQALEVSFFFHLVFIFLSLLFVFHFLAIFWFPEILSLSISISFRLLSSLSFPSFSFCLSSISLLSVH